jgi:hypothetical protein
MERKSPLLSLIPHMPLRCAAVLVFLALTSAVVESAPLTLTLANPNQTVALPSSGITTLDFTGSITLDPGYKLGSATVFSPSNSSGTDSLIAAFAPPFITFFSVSGTGSYTGSLFTVDVSTGTPPDLYAYRVPLPTPSTFQLSAFNNETQDQSNASQAFSVLVTDGDGTSVPDNGKTVLLFGFSAAVIYLFQRVIARAESCAKAGNLS